MVNFYLEKNPVEVSYIIILVHNFILFMIKKET